MRSAVANWERPVSKCQSSPASRSCSPSQTPEKKRDLDKIHTFFLKSRVGGMTGLSDILNTAVKYN